VKHFILDEGPDAQGGVRLSGKDYHYLVRVRRMKAGDIFSCLLPSGEQAKLRIAKIENQALGAEIVLDDYAEERKMPHDKETRLPPILLFQAMPKGSKMDSIVRQVTEAGAGEIIPFYSQHSVPRPVTGTGGRVERWRRIVKEARQQSGSAIDTTLRPPVGIDELIEYWQQIQVKHKKALGLLVHEILLEKGSFHEYLDRTPELIALSVGPEGGFSDSEARRFTGAGFKSVLLGNTILRTENAAFYSMAVVRTLLLEKSSWKHQKN
jgi:16S rRNA (uracil1498-N3)-methyltransferase